MLSVGEYEDVAAWLRVSETCALYNVCSRAVVRRSAVYPGSAREAYGQAVLLNGKAPKVESLGSWEMHSLALGGRVMGLQCMTLLMLKQMHSVSCRASSMGDGSSYSSCWFWLCCLCNFLSLV